MPPVTEAKSPPDSRITGADSPVMALSSTEAAPSMTSPSAGIVSPASTSTTSPLRRSSALTDVVVLRRDGRGVRNFLAMTVWRMPRSAAACARLRPSASASAKLANSTVKSSHTVMARMNACRRLAVAGERLDEQHRGDDRAEVDHEHHRVAPLHARIELLD